MNQLTAYSLQLTTYVNTWWTVIMRPIYFYTKLKEENWQGEALTFFLITSWLLALAATLAIFVVQYIPIGSTLIEGMSAFKFIIILPVLLVLIIVFFAITFLILGGTFAVGFFAMFFLIGFLLHYVYLCLGGRGSLNRIIQSLLYSSAILLVAVFIFLLMVFTRYGELNFALFRVGFNLVCFVTLLYIYGLWAIASRKTYGVPKWKAFLGAIIPIIILLIFGILFDKIALSKLQPWIT